MIGRAATRAKRALLGLLALVQSIPRGRRWALVTAWMALIFLMSAQSASGEQSGFLLQLLTEAFGVRPSAEQGELLHHLLRKGAHVTEYAVLAALAAWALPPGRWRWIGAWAFATVYAASDELHQAFVPHRGPTIGDVGIDSFGAAVAVALLAALSRWIPRPGGCGSGAAEQ